MKFIIAAAILLTGTCAFAQRKGKPFKLNGIVATGHRDSVFLAYTNTAGEHKRDKQAIVNDHFSFTGDIEGAESAVISFDHTNKAIWRIFIEQTTMTLKIDPDDLTGLKLLGSKTQIDFETYNKSLETVNQKSKLIYSALKTEKDLEAKKKLREEVAVYEKQSSNITYNFLKSHPSSYVTAYLLQFHGIMMSFDSLKTIYSALSPALKQRKITKAIGSQIAAKEATLPGNMARDFTTTDVNGKPISLSEFRGKYVLLDFWASWCVPCRKSHPHLREIYAKYKGRGLEIIGIADDEPRPAVWRAAIAQDSIGMWRHVLDGVDPAKVQKGIENPKDLMAKYGVNALPTKFLIDPQGKIIAKFIGDGGEEIDKEIAKIFN